MKYRKKPVTVEAFQLGIEDSPDWFKNKVDSGEILLYRVPFEKSRTKNYGQLFCKINTLEGVMEAHEGDYIIQGVSGEVYPCKPDIFKKTYEPEASAELKTDSTRILTPEENKCELNVSRGMSAQPPTENFENKINNIFKLIKGYSLDELAAHYVLKHPSSPCYICDYDAGLVCTKETCTQGYKIALYKKFLEKEVINDDLY